MRILALTRYSRLGASTRLRTLQYLPALERAGLRIEVAPFFDDAYLTDLYSGRRNLGRTAGYYTQRINKMRAAGGVDLIWIEQEALPWVPWAFERAMLPRSVPYVVDYDDSVFHRYDLHSNPVIRFVLGAKIDRVMAGAACVMVGNDYLARRAFDSGAQRVEYVPTVVDMERYATRTHDRGEGAVRIGWIGTPKTWKGSAEPVFDILDPVLSQKRARFCAVGARLSGSRIGNLDVVEWSEDTEVAEIQAFDIGIMPLHDDPWTRGKCGYKLIQYMACGVPVVASPIGVNRTIVQHGINGFLAETPQEWRDAITTLIEQPELRRRMGAEGRKLVQAHYSLQSWCPRLFDILSAGCRTDAGAAGFRQEQTNG